MLRSASITITAVSLLALVCAGASADDSKLHVDIASVDSSAFPSLSAVVNVLDANGLPVAGLDLSAMQASVDYKPATIEAAQPVVDSQVALSVVLAVDVSGSMAGQPLSSAQQAATDFVRGLSPQDSVSILTFGDSINTVLEPTTDKDAVAAALAGLNAGGNTALYEATNKTIAEALASPSARRAIVLLSDGVDYGGKSDVSRDDSLAQARAAGVPVYTIGLGTEIDRNYLNELATATGARFLETPSPAGLSQLYGDIAGLLRGQYIVKLKSPQADAGVTHTLSLSVTTGGVTAVASKDLPAAVAGAAAPRLALTGLVSGDNVKAMTTITAEAQGSGPLEVRFLLDGKPLADTTTPPYTVSIDPAALKNGKHSLHVEARDASGRNSALDMTFAVGAGGGSAPSPQLIGALVATAICVFGLIRLRRRRPEMRRKVVQVRLRPWSNGGGAGGGPSPADEEPVLLFPPEPVPEEEPLAKLVMVGGPNAGKEFPVGTTPLSVGTADWCDIVLADDGGLIGAEEARAWIHGDKMMFHKLTRLTVLAMDGAIGGWLVLENGDEVSVGPYRLRLEVLAAPTSEQVSVNKAVADAVEQLTARPSEGWLWPSDDFSAVPPAEDDLDTPAASSA